VVMPKVGMSIDRPGADEVLPVDDFAAADLALKIDGSPASASFSQDPSGAIILRRSSAEVTWGMELEVTPAKDVLVIAKIHGVAGGAETAMTIHNRTAPQAAQVSVGDCVVRVNGKADTGTMMRLLQREVEIAIVTKRPSQHRITVPKNGRALGFSLKYLESGASVFVGSVDPAGAASAAKADVQAGDRIIEVNGLSSPVEMVSELKNHPAPEILISRLM